MSPGRPLFLILFFFIFLASRVMAQGPDSSFLGSLSFGAGFYFGSGGRDYIGNLTALVPFINFHLFSKKTVALNFRLGTGVSWVQMPGR
ncbi:MAG TPA: hypothetical protein VK563_21425 [Puia sp.]|nr:hypothetical protein [Puia sp.]